MMRTLGLMTAAAALALAACGGEEQAASATAAEDAATPASATTVAAAQSGGAVAFPRTRPGLWRIVHHDEDGAGDPEEKCITAEESERMASDPVAALEMSPECSNRITREGAAFVIRATCPQGGPTAEVRATGDFQNSYTMNVSIRPATPEPTEIKGRIEGTRVGDC